MNGRKPIDLKSYNNNYVNLTENHSWNATFAKLYKSIAPVDLEENLTGAVAGPKSPKMSPLVLHFPVKSGLQSGIVRQNVIKYSCIQKLY